MYLTLYSIQWPKTCKNSGMTSMARLPQRLKSTLKVFLHFPDMVTPFEIITFFFALMESVWPSQIPIFSDFRVLCMSII